VTAPAALIEDQSAVGICDGSCGVSCNGSCDISDVGISNALAMVPAKVIAMDQM